MSSAHAIAIVSHALVRLLQETVNPVVTGASAFSRHPRDIANDKGRYIGVNLYLYQVIPNAAWRNVEVSVRLKQAESGDERRPIARVPVIPLNLHYMISFYGNEHTYEPHRLLAAALPALHMATSRLPAYLEQAAQEVAEIAHHPPREQTPYDDHRPPARKDTYPQELTDRELEAVEETISMIEKIKLSPVQLNLEELSKLWSVFFQVPYALSVAYEASVVLLATGEPKWKLTPEVTTLNRHDDKGAPAQTPEEARREQGRREHEERLRREHEEQLRREHPPWRSGPRPPEGEAP